MASKKDPAFLMYSGDFIAGTQHMNCAEVGAYVRLLMYQHQHEQIPNDIDKMMRITLIQNRKEFLKIWGEISCKFKSISVNHLVNERLTKEIEERKKSRPKKTAAACLAGLISSHKTLSREQINQIKKQFDITLFIEEQNDDKIKEKIKIWFTEMVNQMVNNLINKDINKDINNISIDNVKGGAGEKFQDQEINSRKLPQNHKTQFGIVFSDLEPLEYIKKHYPNFYTTQVMNARISEDKLSLFNEQARYVSYQNEFHFQSSFKKFIKDHGKHQNNTNRAGATAAIRSGHVKDFNA